MTNEFDSLNELQLRTLCFIMTSDSDRPIRNISSAQALMRRNLVTKTKYGYELVPGVEERWQKWMSDKYESEKLSMKEMTILP